MKLRQLPSGSWTTQIQIDGHRRSITAKSKAECERLAMEYSLTRSDVSFAPLGMLIDKYISIKENVLSASTTARYKQIRRLDFQELMNIPVGDLTSERMQTAINIMAVDHSPKSVRNAYGLVSATLKLFTNRTLHVTLPKRDALVYDIPSTEDVYRLLTAASDNMRTAIMLAAFCGLRRGEIVALRSSDIEGNVINVRRSAVYNSDREVVIKAPKTYASSRRVTAPDFVIDQLKDKTEEVCPLTLNSITRRFVELRDSLGMTCRFHDLRHYYASALHAIGIKDQYIMKFGGWKSDHVLKSVYRDTLDDFEQIAADRAAQFFSESANECKQNHEQIAQNRAVRTGSNPVCSMQHMNRKAAKNSVVERFFDV